jgi:DNA repair photolyase
MILNKSKGNMFDFVDGTWNPIKGSCLHDCTYCFMKKWGLNRLKPPRLVDAEMKKDLGENNYIFICSSTDIFAKNIPNDWLLNIFCKAIGYRNKYLVQTKNPERILKHLSDLIPQKFILSTTIETNYFFPENMKNSPMPNERAHYMALIPKEYRRMVTIEPIMKFDLTELVAMVMSFNPDQINIGADSCGHCLPEPSARETQKLIEVLRKYKDVVIKHNLKRILKQGK